MCNKKYVKDYDVKDFVVFGDWHSNTRYANNAISKAMSLYNPDYFLHVGDFGVFETKEDYIKSLEETLASYNRELWFIDGNHEDFEMLKSYPYDDRGLQKVTDHIYRIPRGYSWEWSGKKFVALGGAHSIDMRFRQPGLTWWPDEMIVEEDFQKTISNENADFMITHEAPWLPHEILNEPAIFNSLLSESVYLSKICRDYIAKTLDVLNPSILVHGHHHKFYESFYRNTKVIGLNRDGFDFSKNLAYFKIENI